MESFNISIKNLSKNKIYLILIGLAVVLLATVLIYAYVEFLSDKISVIPTEEGKPYCGAIGSRSEGWYINSDSNRPELIRWDNCEGCVAVCKAIGSRSEGWYSSCDGKLIKYDNCGEGQEEGNLPPIIDSLIAPTQVKVNENNVWTIKARDPENGVLSYSVNWGDEYAKIALSESAPAELDTRSQTTTFTHNYNKIGTYTIKFIITDNHQQTAEASTTVEVVSKISEATCTDSDGGINKYVKGTTCRKLHYGSSAGVDMISCKTDMCDGICYSQSTSTNLDGKESNITSSSHGDPTSTNLKNDHKVPSLPSYYKDFPPIEPPIPVNPINADAPLVKEYYCENGKIMSKHIHCENGCKDGACIKEKQTCDAKCKSLNYKSGICRTWPIVPDAEIGCKENEKDIGYTSDCCIFKDVLGNPLVGVGKTCCCKIECNEKLNKEDCELVGGEYKSACNSFGCEYWCECPCITDSDCTSDFCQQGRCANDGDAYCCYENTYKCENGKCEHTKKEYKSYTCSHSTNKCLDTCGDGVCKFPEAKWWCPEDCGGGCLDEGETFMPSEDKQCCSGLEAITRTHGDGINCTIPMGYVCTSSVCGNEKCEGPYENKCSCSKDCPGPVCTPEGSRKSPGGLSCCEGLTEIPCGTFMGGKCIMADEGSVFCTKCGDGICKYPENICNCPEDCKEETDCIGEGGIYKEWTGIIKGECCEGLHVIASGYRNNISYCTSEVCGNGECKELENKWNCPEDCGTAPDCRDENYGCTPDPIPCCPGLKSSGLYGDPNDCSGAMANCGTICIPCGNGVCDANEGICNCPEDCKEEETLSADLNCDGKVNLADAAILLSFWSKDPSEATDINQNGVVEESILSPCKNPDINQDGKVNLADFSIIMSQWTK